jgi:hypothetical protein
MYVPNYTKISTYGYGSVILFAKKWGKWAILTQNKAITSEEKMILTLVFKIIAYFS